MMDQTNATLEPKAVLAISSQVARGSVGLRAAGFAMERLGVPVWKVPTIWMPWHPGHAASLGPPPRSPTADAVFEESLKALVASPVIGEVGALLTGYFASAAQVWAVCAAIDAMREVCPELVVICDPVSADSHGTYVPEDVVEALREGLLPRCDIATPNRYEAAAFSGHAIASDNQALIAMAQALPARASVITSAFGMMRGSTASLLVHEAGPMLIEHQEVPGAPHGTGDTLSALLAAHLMLGKPRDGAAISATASVFELVARSVKAGSDELLLAREQASLARPMAMVTTRQLALAKKGAAKKGAAKKGAQ